jgi:hypothetical protein
MCLPAAGAVFGLLGSAVSAMGSMAQANAAAANAEYNAKVEKINARSRRQEGLQESERIGEKYNQLQGQQTAGYAKAGVDPFYGSALRIVQDTWESRGIDQGTNYTKAESAAVGHENKATQYEYEAKSQRQAGRIGAASSFLSGLSGAVKGFGGSSGGGGVGSILQINKVG